jgi:hypothetical protein
MQAYSRISFSAFQKGSLMYRIGDMVALGGVNWEVEGFETDEDGYLCVALIEPDITSAEVADGNVSARIVVRELSSLHIAVAA